MPTTTTRLRACRRCHNRFNPMYHGHDTFCGSCQDSIATWKSVDAPFDGAVNEIRSSRRFGIELETSDCPNYRLLNGKVCYGAKYDPTVNGMEFVSPILQGDKGLRLTRGFCTRARHMGFKVNVDCGYHLHFDVRENTNLQRRHIAAAYAHTSKFWAGLVDTYRALECSWCEPIDWSAQEMKTEPDFKQVCSDSHRYTWFNIYSFLVHGTFEIRLHQATLDGVAVCNWVKAHLRFADFVQDMKFHEIRNMFDVPAKQMWKAVTNTWNDVALRRYYKESSVLRRRWQYQTI